MGGADAPAKWTVGLVAIIAGGVAVASGGILRAVGQPRADGTQAALAVDVGLRDLRLVGSW
jgi:hypothetical protein